MYPPELVAPMKQDLTDVGFVQLMNTEEVANAIKSEGTTLVVVNSVCGCAAGNARPGVKQAIQNSKKPDVLSTVFAGVDVEATNAAREHMLPFPPSSPSIALFKSGTLVHMLERHHIEGASAQMISANLIEAFNEFC